MCKLTEKLRSYNPTSGYSRVMREAADEIDRLRSALQKVCKAPADYDCHYKMTQVVDSDIEVNP